jgi:hypothetical protein
LASVAAVIFALLFFAQAYQAGSKARQLPVQVTYRKALLGNGYVLALHNRTRESLALNVTLTNPTFNRTKTYSVVVDAGAIQEIGYLQGWTFTAGDQIEVDNAKYDALKVMIP